MGNLGGLPAGGLPAGKGITPTGQKAPSESTKPGSFTREDPQSTGQNPPVDSMAPSLSSDAARLTGEAKPPPPSTDPTVAIKPGGDHLSTLEASQNSATTRQAGNDPVADPDDASVADGETKPQKPLWLEILEQALQKFQDAVKQLFGG